MPDVPGIASAAELERLPHAELAALLAGAYQLIGQLRARVEHLERAAGKDSSISSRPPSSDSPFKKKPRVRDLLAQAPAVHADETPARAVGALRYVHLACTGYLALMHTGDRSAAATGAGGVPPGYRGVLVRDGYTATGTWPARRTPGAARTCCATCLLLWTRDTAAADALRRLFNGHPGIPPALQPDG